MREHKYMTYDNIVTIMDRLHDQQLYELEAWVSFGLDTGFRSVDFKRLMREDIVDGKIAGFHCDRFDNLYPDVKLSKRSVALLEYLPVSGVLFPEKQYTYLLKVRTNTTERFYWHELRRLYIQQLLEQFCEK